MKLVKHIAYSALGWFISTRGVYGIDPFASADIDEDLKGLSGTNPITVIQNFIIGLLGFLGLIMVFMALWGGWKILTSGAEDEGKEAGKKIIINAAIGIVVIFFAWTITSLVFGILVGEGQITGN